MTAPTKDELWKKYPRLPALWSEYITLCRSGKASIAQISAAFSAYAAENAAARNRYQIEPMELATAGAGI